MTWLQAAVAYLVPGIVWMAYGWTDVDRIVSDEVALYPPEKATAARTLLRGCIAAVVVAAVLAWPVFAAWEITARLQEWRAHGRH